VAVLFFQITYDTVIIIETYTPITMYILLNTSILFYKIDNDLMDIISCAGGGEPLNLSWTRIA